MFQDIHAREKVDGIRVPCIGPYKPCTNLPFEDSAMYFDHWVCEPCINPTCMRLRCSGGLEDAFILPESSKISTCHSQYLLNFLL